MKLFRLTVLWKILLSTSLALTVLFGVTAYFVQRSVIETAQRNLEEEVKASFRAYESLWKARADLLASVSKVLSTMSDVRGAFSTRDQATIQDTAQDIWSRISQEGALFLVTDPNGHVIASLGDRPGTLLNPEVSQVRVARRAFPKQATGFMVENGQLAQIVITPVYIDSGAGQALLNVLVAGYNLDDRAAKALKEATGGSEFLFVAGGRPITSTLSPLASAELVRKLGAEGHNPPNRVDAAGIDYAPLVRPLVDVEGKRVGDLWILRSFESAQQRLAALQRDMFLIWLAVLTGGLLLTYLLAKHIMRPIATLDRAAAEVAQQNYDCRVPVHGHDELARLAGTFNAMCASIEQARDELIRHEQISTIGRLSTSIVHDLRSPLAAIYGGAEMLVDSQLSPVQVNRLANNIYKASRQIQELLQDLVNVSRGKTGAAEVCNLHELIADAWGLVAANAERHRVKFDMRVPDDVEIFAERGRMERVFLNLMENAIEAMPNGGELHVEAAEKKGETIVTVADTGPGISATIRDRLFQPFVTAGKKNGLGLGLALSRQTVLDNGGDLWVDGSSHTGARFCVRLPVAKFETAGA